MTNKNIIDDMPFIVPETATEEFWQMSGRMEALRSYLKALAKKNASKTYLNKPLDDDMEMVCILLGFTDVMSIGMLFDGEEDVKDEHDVV